MSEETKPVLLNSALGLVRNGNQMDIVRIKYNIETKEVGSLEIIASEDGRKTGEERFKILAVKEGLFT